jgi:hypothetical protein
MDIAGSSLTPHTNSSVKFKEMPSRKMEVVSIRQRAMFTSICIR